MPTVRERWKLGGYNHEMRLTVRCTKNQTHSKTLRLDAAHWSFEMLDTMGQILDGSSPAYILKPGPSSPIGRCAVCGGILESTVEEVGPDAEPRQQVDKSVQ